MIVREADQDRIVRCCRKHYDGTKPLPEDAPKLGAIEDARENQGCQFCENPYGGPCDDLDVGNGWLALVPRILSPDEREYVRLFIAEATLGNDGHWSVSKPSRALRACVTRRWAVTRPGWLEKDGSVHPKTISHYGIEHHLANVGVKLLSPSEAAAHRVLRARPELAGQKVWSYLGYAEFPDLHTLESLLATEGSCVTRAEPTLNLDAYDTEDVIEIDPVPRRGRSVVDFIRSLKLRSQP